MAMDVTPKLAFVADAWNDSLQAVIGAGEGTIPPSRGVSDLRLKREARFDRIP